MSEASYKDIVASAIKTAQDAARFPTSDAAAGQVISSLAQMVIGLATTVSALGGTLEAIRSTMATQPLPAELLDKAYCKGSWRLGNNCKVCWRCRETDPARQEQPAPTRAKMSKIPLKCDACGAALNMSDKCPGCGAAVPRLDMPREERAAWLLAMLQDPNQGDWRACGGYSAEPYTTETALVEVARTFGP